jgi:tripartite-type tricarboxylate transporter receptor subunit TctC
VPTCCARTRRLLAESRAKIGVSAGVAGHAGSICRLSYQRPALDVFKLNMQRSSLLKLFQKLLLALLFVPCLLESSWAQGHYPDKPVRVIVPYTVGGSSDVIARAIGDALSKALGQAVVVENRAGAGSLIGTQYVTGQEADGYTLLLADVPFTIVPALYRERAHYDAQRDFAPIALLGVAPMYLFVNSSFPARSAADLIRLAKARPGTITIGSGGNGSLTHLLAELFMINTETKLVHVPYKGAAASVADLAAGQINASFTSMASAYPLYQAGTIRAIAVTGAERSKDTPGVPTFKDAGISTMAVSSWWGLLAPAGVSQPVRETLTAAMRTVMQDTAVKARLAVVGVSAPADAGPAALQQLIKTDVARWHDVIGRADIKVE